ncbi:MAG: glycosyltransferase family 2 protein [Akkermansia sp.]|nr:glycosyltransferase family 2 protein [Akkermansia sp.]
MTSPVISVIVPVYNTAPWLRRCLDSICSQSYGNLEILCINDGSTDNSAEILKEYAAKDARIKVFTQENAGLSAARNTGLEHSTGEWVTGVDSDDYLYPGIYEQALKHRHDDVDMVFFGVQQVDEEYNLLPPNQYFSLPKEGKYKLTPELAAQLNVCFVSKLWRRSLIEENALRFPVGLVHEDEAMYYLAAPYVKNIAIYSAIGYAYMQRNGSIINSVASDILKKTKRNIPVIEYVYNEYKKRNFITSLARKHLIIMFMRTFADRYHAGSAGNKEELHRLIAATVQKYKMLGYDYRLDRFVKHENRGSLTITRKENFVLYWIWKIPVWGKIYTRHGQKITFKVLIFHLKQLIKRIFHI